MAWNSQRESLRRGSLLLTTAINAMRIQEISKTMPSLAIEQVTDIAVKGQGCFILYEKNNFRAKIMKVHSGFENHTKIPMIGSIEYFPNCKNEKLNTEQMRRYIFVGGSFFAAILMLAVLFLTFGKRCKSGAKDRNTFPEQAEGKKVPEKMKLGVNYSTVWDEILCWREHFSWTGAITMILLGLVPTTLDVSTDYAYADTWKEINWGYNLQVRALVHFFICLPHLMTIVKVVNSWITNLFDFPQARTSSRLLGKSVGVVLFLAFLASITFGFLYLGWEHPNAFFYFALPSASVSIGAKIAGIFVQGPEAKRALTRVAAR